MEEILHQLIGSLSHYLPGFIHPRQCRISSINRSTFFSNGWLEDDPFILVQVGPIQPQHFSRGDSSPLRLPTKYPPFSSQSRATWTNSPEATQHTTEESRDPARENSVAAIPTHLKYIVWALPIPTGSWWIFWWRWIMVLYSKMMMMITFPQNDRV